MNHKHHKEPNRTGRNALVLHTATDMQFNSHEASANKRPRSELVLFRARLLADCKWTYIDYTYYIVRVSEHTVKGLN